ncbi:MAG: glycosyltransferase [Candidatus Parcubacteria bacterium]|nr:glycosyltransferase [Candidatus Parcubacteria bacterium]
MRLVIATPLYPPDIGGPATDAALLAKHLPAHGIEVEVYSFGLVRHLPRGIRHVRYAYGLWRRARGADVIVAMDTFSVCLPAALVARVTRKCFVVRVPGDFVWEQAVQRFGVTDTIEVFQQKRYGFRVETLRTLQRFAVQQADLVVACSDFLKSIVATWGVAPERLTRIYLGLDFDDYAEAPQNVPEGKIVFSVGRLVPWKGFMTLIRIMPELAGWHLVIAGDGPLRGVLLEQARALAVSDRVTFLGALPRAQVLGWLQRADAFAFNTSFESFSYQLLEAMASGTPIITTPVGSIPELITDGSEGALCAPDGALAFKNALMSIEREPESWKKLTEAAMHRAHTFTAERTAELFAEALKKICA